MITKIRKSGSDCIVIGLLVNRKQAFRQLKSKAKNNPHISMEGS